MSEVEKNISDHEQFEVSYEDCSQLLKDQERSLAACVEIQSDVSKVKELNSSIQVGLQ